MKKLFILFFLILGLTKTQASHIVGGDLNVTWQSGNTFEVKLTLWRDCTGLDFDNINTHCVLTNPLPSVEIATEKFMFQPFTDTRYLNQEFDIILGIFDKVTNVKLDSLYMRLKSKRFLTLGDTCYKPTGLCIEEGIYTNSIVLNNNPNGYYISWQRCCRNNTIDNATDPTNAGSGEAGMVFYAAIPNPAIQNSTPEFAPFTKGYFCINTLNILNDFKATDRDGDVLVYSLVNPLNGYAVFPRRYKSSGQLWSDQGCANTLGITVPGPYPIINWVSPYSLNNIVGGNQPMTIDPNTGVLTAMPDKIGTYVFEVLVEEFRNGVKIGEIRRDVQYQVIACTNNSGPAFSEPVTGNYKAYTIVAGDKLCFPVTLNDPDVNDSITITGSGDLLNNPALTSTSFTPVSGFKTGTTELCATTSCESIRENPYKIKFTGKDYSCYGVNTVTLDVDVFVVPPKEGQISEPPNVFTPNGDGKNDVYELTSVTDYCKNEFSITIYDRWGLKVYESTDLNFKWDGKYMENGKDLTAGVYYYLITSTFRLSTYEHHGFITLFR
jgi:gliding motility-associated-like protein